MKSEENFRERRANSECLAGEIGEDGFGGAASTDHGAVNGSVIAVIATKINARTDAHRALRGL